MLDLPRNVKIRILEFMAYLYSHEEPSQPFGDEEILYMLDAQTYVVEEKLLLAGRNGGVREARNGWDPKFKLEPFQAWRSLD